MKKPELKPCPYCGKEPALNTSRFPDGRGYWVECNNTRCYVSVCTIREASEKRVIDIWNTRAENT